MQTIGERVKQARHARSLSQRELAQAAAPLSAMSISKYERDKAVPGSDVLLRLASALGVKHDYFLKPTTVKLHCPAYRKEPRLSKKAQQATENQIIGLMERYLAVEEVFEPGDVASFSIPKASRTPVRTLEGVEQVAEDLRAEWGLGEDPIANLAEVLEDQGVKVVLLPEAHAKVSGFSCWANETIPVVASRMTDDLPGDRQRFNLAHELGHLLLTVDEDVDDEAAAHRFAGAFLVPRPAVLREIGSRRTTITFDELHSLKHKWGLSIQAWMHRLSELGIVTVQQHCSVQKLFKDKGWKLREPGEQVPCEHTGRLERLVHRAVAEDRISVSRAADFLNKPLIEVYGEMGWPEGRKEG